MTKLRLKLIYYTVTLESPLKITEDTKKHIPTEVRMCLKYAG